MTHSELKSLVEQIPSLHARYCALTGLVLPLTMRMRFSWEAWLAGGFRENDLVTVVAHIKSRIKANRRRSESLLFRNLIENVERCHEDLAEARAEGRRPRVDTDRASVLRATGRVAVEQERVETPAQVMLRMNQLAALRAWRKENAG